MRRTRNTTEKIALFSQFFTGLTHAYGTYDLKTGHSYVVKKPVTSRVYFEHLKGLQPYGVYLLEGDRTRAVAVDFDIDDANLPLDFVAAAKHYSLPAYIERSKSKGYHVWIFFDQEGVPASKARMVVSHILEEIEAEGTEVFPKQDRLANGISYGNFINAPLFGSLVLKGRTVFLSDDTLEPCPNQWDFLESIERVPEQTLDDVIEINELVQAAPAQHAPLAPEKEHLSFGLPPCARRMLTEGVTQNQRVSCFRLAVQLKKIGVPQDCAIAALNAWSLKNNPEIGKGIITETEIISQTEYAYKNGYSSCGCEDPAVKPFCDHQCPVRKERV